MCTKRPHADVKLLQEHCASVRIAGPDEPMADAIVAAAEEVGASAVLTLNEWAIAAVSEACQRLGLRGAGPNVLRSRDKFEMRSVWRDHGVPIPQFVAVRSFEDLQRAYRELPRPFLLKPSWAAASAGQAIVDSAADLQGIWNSVNTAMIRLGKTGAQELMHVGRGPQFIAEEIIESTTASWYEMDGWGDYVSVEGIVAAGRYHPICMTARLPTIPPFIEVSNHAPAALSTDKQRRIEEVARAAVDALELDFCGTHTEIKLQADGGVCLLESAARLGGWMIVREVAEVFGIDLIDCLVQVLLGRECALPDRMLTSEQATGAATSLVMLAADSKGRPWKSLPAFRPEMIDWRSLTSPSTTAEIVLGHTMASGSPMPPYSSTGGHTNYAGALFLRARDPVALRDDCLRILDGLEEAMCALEGN
jgi:biotin carboxylase